MTEAKLVDSPDTAHSAIVEGHPYEPKNPDQPWSLCRHCNLAQATHADPGQEYRVTGKPAPPEKPPPNARPVDKGEPDPGEDEVMPLPPPEIDITELQIMDLPQWSGVICDTCSNEMVRTGTCYSCPGCGNTTGCG